eukprot:TRINITY_DN9535_c0_g1_i1.p1 TRINITY_DN9535_c0_g1~~TRINITY_DN9535_c0_g1_i1.p1  ORF type:complete len:242 (-),score=43.93 TRINITY_DN9535_c0_g1_i1:62-787(-)
MLLSTNQHSCDALLSRARLHQDTYFGPISDIINEDHADTVALLSTAILNTPKGERGLRAFLQHLRALLGRSPVYIEGLQQRVMEAERRAAVASGERSSTSLRAHESVTALEAELAAERGLRAAEAAAWASKFDSMQRSFGEERASWASEVQRLRGERDRSDALAALAAGAEGLCARATWESAARGRAELADLRALLEREALERSHLQSELALARWQLAENSRLLAGERELRRRRAGAAGAP